MTGLTWGIIDPRNLPPEKPKVEPPAPTTLREPMKCTIETLEDDGTWKPIKTIWSNPWLISETKYQIAVETKKKVRVVRHRDGKVMT